MTKKEALAYIAGLIDGEGYVGIVKRSPGKNKMHNPKYTTRVAISMTRKEPLEFVRKFFGVNKTKFRIKYKHRPLLNHKDCYCLDVENEDALRICKCVLPFLLIKNKQAKIVIGLRNIQRLSPSKRRPYKGNTHTANNRSGCAPTRFLSDAYLRKCERLYLKVKTLNKRGCV